MGLGYISMSNMKGFDDSQERASQKGYRAGMERAAEIADKYPTGWQAAEAIRAELEPVTQPEER
jgi:ribosome modulation factor